MIQDFVFGPQSRSNVFHLLRTELESILRRVLHVYDVSLVLGLAFYDLILEEV